jgi:hypothetical protein
MSAWRLRRATAALVAIAAAGWGTSGAVASSGSAHRMVDPPSASPRAGHPSPLTPYQRALQLGTEAYVYGYPLLDTVRVFRTSTSVNVPNGAGGGPVNAFSHIRRLAHPSDRTVVAPNHDTLYSMAWLDLRGQPIVVHMPVVRGRFTVFELVDPYTANFANIGSVGHPPGDYAVAAPGWHGRLPRGVGLIRSPYTRVWIIGRTYIRNAADTPNVVRIQNRYSLTPLDRWGTRYVPPRPARVNRRSHTFTVPGTTPGSDPLRFFDALGDALRQFPPPRADRTLLASLAGVGIGPGLHPSTESRLNAAVRTGLRDAVAAGARQITADLQHEFLARAPQHNGWLVARTGRYGTDYAGRALVDRVGLGAPQSSLAIYPFTVTDSTLHPLTGATRYVAHISARYLPFPVRSFWSMTLYDAHGFFVPNPAKVYLINNRSPVHYNADGSLDLYIQPGAPHSATQRHNWLPSPAGRAFRLIMRLYRPTDVAGVISGRTWEPPTVLPCLPDGRSSAGTACAS